jgi:hypothetical protein
MHRTSSTIAAAAIALGMSLAGCDDPGPAAAPARPDPPVTINPADAADVTEVYLCDEGTRIDIVRGKVARVTLNDGKVVKLELLDGSSPRTYMDNGLSFIVGPEGAELGEDDPEGRSLACRASTAGR